MLTDCWQADASIPLMAGGAALFHIHVLARVCCVFRLLNSPWRSASYDGYSLYNSSPAMCRMSVAMVNPQHTCVSPDFPLKGLWVYL